MQRLENIKESIESFLQDFDNIALKNKVLDFFSEYDANKDTKSINSVEELNQVINFDDVWYIDLHNEGNLREIPEKLFLCQNLKALDVSFSHVKDLGNINQFQHIKCLFAQNASLHSFPEAILELSNLFFLDLSQNKIRKIENNIDKLENIVLLDMSKNIIKSLPMAFTKLKNLMLLNLSNNEIKNLNYSFELANLRYLDIGDNIPIKNIQRISNLQLLNYIDLSNNNFHKIPDEICSLANLKVFIFSENPIRTINPLINKMEKLENILLESCELTFFPKEVLYLKNLSALILSNNQICEIPEEIYQLEKLDTLIISDNKLEYLPESIGRLSELTTLHIQNNKLKEYPKSLAKLRKLRSLGLSKALGDLLQNPFGIDHGNPLDNMPEEVKNYSIVELFDYLEGDKEVYTYYTFWDIPKELKADFQAYLASFPQYVEMIAGKDISESFKTEQVKGGLKLTAITSKEVHIEDFDNHLANYVTIFLEQSAEQMKADKENNADYIQVFKLQQYLHKLRQVNRNLTDSIETYKRESELYTQILKDKEKQVQELNIQIRFFQDNYSKILDIAKSTLDFDKIKLVVETVIEEKQRPLLPAPPTNGNGFDAGKLLRDLIDKAIRLTERKKTHKIEDLHNNDFAHYLRDRHYYVTDQTQSGIGITGKNLGEIDIMLRNRHSGTPISIIEAFRLDSCGEKDTIVSTHLDKLLHNYDTAGLKTNFVIVYAEAKNFGQLWENYVKYMQNLNTKPEFRGKYPLITFTDTSAGNSVALSVRVGLALHQREGGTVEVYHIFIDMA